MKRKKGLIVDDNLLIRVMIKEMLEDKYEIVGDASNGKDALRQYKEKNPDFVVMDIMMPEMNGFEAVLEIMRYDAKAKIIMVSAANEQVYVNEAIKSGACAYIVKPIIKEELRAGIQKVLEETP